MVIRSLLSSQGPCWDLSQLQAPIYLPPSTTVLISTQLFIVFLPYTIITPLDVPPPQAVAQGRDCQLLCPKATSSHLIVPSHPLCSHHVVNDIPSVFLITSITQSLANSSHSNPHPKFPGNYYWHPPATAGTQWNFPSPHLFIFLASKANIAIYFGPHLVAKTSVYVTNPIIPPQSLHFDTDHPHQTKQSLIFYPSK